VKDIDKVALTYNDSRNPGRVRMDIDTGGVMKARLDLSAAQAVELAERLLTAVRSEGYSLTAKKGR
jgi:hypothetical protein